MTHITTICLMVLQMVFIVSNTQALSKAIGYTYGISPLIEIYPFVEIRAWGFADSNVCKCDSVIKAQAFVLNDQRFELWWGNLRGRVGNGLYSYQRWIEDGTVRTRRRRLGSIQDGSLVRVQFLRRREIPEIVAATVSVQEPGREIYTLRPFWFFPGQEPILEHKLRVIGFSRGTMVDFPNATIRILPSFFQINTNVFQIGSGQFVPGSNSLLWSVE